MKLIIFTNLHHVQIQDCNSVFKCVISLYYESYSSKKGSGVSSSTEFASWNLQTIKPQPINATACTFFYTLSQRFKYLLLAPEFLCQESIPLYQYLILSESLEGTNAVLPSEAIFPHKKLLYRIFQFPVSLFSSQKNKLHGDGFFAMDSNVLFFP